MVIALESYVFAVADVSGESNEHDYITVHATDLGEAQEKAEQMAKEEYPQWGKVSIECLESEAFDSEAKARKCASCDIHSDVDKCTKCGNLTCMRCTSQSMVSINDPSLGMEFLCPSCTTTPVHVFPGTDMRFHEAESFSAESKRCSYCKTENLEDFSKGWDDYCMKCAKRHHREYGAESFAADLYKGQPCPHEWEEDKVKDWGDGIFTIYVSCKNCGTKSHIEGHADEHTQSHTSPNSPYSAESFSAEGVNYECLQNGKTYSRYRTKEMNTLYGPYPYKACYNCYTLKCTKALNPKMWGKRDKKAESFSAEGKCDMYCNGKNDRKKGSLACEPCAKKWGEKMKKDKDFQRNYNPPEDYYRAESFSAETWWTNCEKCGTSTNHNMMLTREDYYVFACPECNTPKNLRRTIKPMTIGLALGIVALFLWGRNR